MHGRACTRLPQDEEVSIVHNCKHNAHRCTQSAYFVVNKNDLLTSLQLIESLAYENNNNQEEIVQLETNNHKSQSLEKY